LCRSMGIDLTYEEEAEALHIIECYWDPR
jgi:hypothetical protein